MTQLIIAHDKGDAPFAKRMAEDLYRLGLDVWHGGYELGGETPLSARIADGGEGQMLALVLSRELLEQPWFNGEAERLLQLEQELGRHFLIPVISRPCELYNGLEGRDAADFSTDYGAGLEALLSLYGYVGREVITLDNWRRFARKQNSSWRAYQEVEFYGLVQELTDVCDRYNLNIWVGGTKNPYSLGVNTVVEGVGGFCLSLRMVPGENYGYFGTYYPESNPNLIPKKEFNGFLGETPNEVVEFVYRHAKWFSEEYGMQDRQPYRFAESYMDRDVRQTHDRLLRAFTTPDEQYIEGVARSAGR